jgi:hypothetical protein
MNLGIKLYHIDKPNATYEVIKMYNIKGVICEGDYLYAFAAYCHPLSPEIKMFRKYDIGRTFFLTREEMLDARITRSKRILALDISAKENKL